MFFFNFSSSFPFNSPLPRSLSLFPRVSSCSRRGGGAQPGRGRSTTACVSVSVSPPAAGLGTSGRVLCAPLSPARPWKAGGGGRELRRDVALPQNPPAQPKLRGEAGAVHFSGRAVLREGGSRLGRRESSHKHTLRGCGSREQRLGRFFFFFNFFSFPKKHG